MSERIGIVNKPPYFDDFDPSKNYSKILFRPGRAVQSRELTQIQTILQNQIATLGDKLLSSPIVSGGELSVNRVKYLKFQASSDPSFLKGKLLSTGTSTMKVLEVKPLVDSYSDTWCNWAIFFEYKSGSELSVSSVPTSLQSFRVKVSDEQSLDSTEYAFRIPDFVDIGTLSGADQNSATGLNVYGDALFARMEPGVLYRKGYFVVSDLPLTLPLSVQTTAVGNDLPTVNTYTNFAPSLQKARVGIDLISSYATVESDPTLYDPSAGYYNYAAPGADRLQITPVLVQLEDTEKKKDIIEIIKVDGGGGGGGGPGGPTIIIVGGGGEDFDPEKCKSDQILKSFTIDIIGTTLAILSGKAIVNCSEIEIVERITIPIVPNSEDTRLYNQAFNDQCLSDAIIVQSNSENPLFGGVGGASGSLDYTAINTNYYGSGKIRRLFSDEAVRLEIVSCEGLKIGCLTVLDIEKNDSTSFRLYYNELQSYTKTIPTTSLFNEACTLSLDGEKVFSIESSVPLTCSDTTPGGSRRLVYKIPTGTNIKGVIDSDYMITRDFIGDISSAEIRFPDGNGNKVPRTATVVEFDMDIPGGVFNDNNTSVDNPDLFIFSINGKVIPIKQKEQNTPHIRVDQYKRKVTLVLGAPDYEPTTADETPITVPTAGKCYMITKVRFPEKTDIGTNTTPIPHRKKRLREARGVYTQDLSKNPTISLGFSDVYRLISVKNSAGTNITSRFIFDDGQRNDRYDHASITLQPGFANAYTGLQEFTVEFRYFEHEPISPGFYGPITVNSYGFNSNAEPIAGFHGQDLNGNQITLSYDEIPNFLDRISGEVISLSDAVDYRMIRTEEGYIEGGQNKSSILRGRWFPSPQASAAVEVAYRFNFPRIDLLVLREDGTCVLRPGEPDRLPVPPEHPVDGLVLAQITVPGRITSSEDFIVQKPPVKAISLPELNDMQNRISELEKALSMQSLENKARVQSSVLRNEFLTGMVIDDFGGHYVGDVSNDEYNCSMDFSNGTLRPPFTTTFVDFIPDEGGGYPTGSTLTSYYVLAPENPAGVTFVENTQATVEITVNPSGIADWRGYLTVDRPYHLWMDQNTKPYVQSNSRGENDAWESGGESSQTDGRKKGFGTQWGFWKTGWFGEPLVTVVAAEKDRASAKAFSDEITSLGSARFSRSINRDALLSSPKRTIGKGGFGLTDSKTNRFVDSALTFFSPQNYLIVRGYSLKPNAEFSVYFEDMNTAVSASRLFDMSRNPLSSVRSNARGEVEFILFIPGGAYIAGNKVVKIVENSASTKRSSASCIYQNIGSSWKDGAVDKDSNMEYEFFAMGRSDVLVKSQNTSYVNTPSVNGITQKFVVDSTEYPKGLLLKNMKFYFSQIDTTAPVSVEIRRVRSGKIDWDQIVRNSRVSVQPLTTGDTEFAFALPVYLVSGEYVAVLRTNSSLYKVHASQQGQRRIDEAALQTEEEKFARIVLGARGVMGGSSIIKNEDTLTTLRFSVGRRSFLTKSLDITISKISKRQPLIPLIGDPDTAHIDYDLLYFANDNTNSSTGSVSYEISTEPNTAQLYPNTETASSGSYAPNTKIDITVSTQREDICPVVDIRKLGLLLVKNHVSKTSGGKSIDIGLEKQNFAGENGSAMKYITRRTDLALPANVLRATIQANLPSNFEMKMYAKVLYEGDINFDEQKYEEMPLVSGSAAIAKDKFTELVFEYDGTDKPKNFISFSVKCVFIYNGDTVQLNPVPEAKNLTVVSSIR